MYLNKSYVVEVACQLHQFALRKGPKLSFPFLVIKKFAELLRKLSRSPVQLVEAPCWHALVRLKCSRPGPIGRQWRDEAKQAAQSTTRYGCFCNRSTMKVRRSEGRRTCSQISHHETSQFTNTLAALTTRGSKQSYHRYGTRSHRPVKNTA